MVADLPARAARSMSASGGLFEESAQVAHAENYVGIPGGFAAGVDYLVFVTHAYKIREARLNASLILKISAALIEA